MRVRAGLCAGLLCAAGSVAQADLCREVRALDAQSGPVMLALPNTGDTVDCTRSLMLSGGSQLHCGWAFPYRAAAAKQAFEHLVAAVADCVGAAAQLQKGLNINHPDYYDLQTFRLEGQEFGVSLKDKAALSETYVFLRVSLPD